MAKASSAESKLEELIRSLGDGRGPTRPIPQKDDHQAGAASGPAPFSPPLSRASRRTSRGAASPSATPPLSPSATDELLGETPPPRPGEASASSGPPPTGTPQTRVFLGPDTGILPDDDAELLKIIQAPQSLAQALAAIDKLGVRHGQNLREEGFTVSPEAFHPLVQSIGVGGSPQAISNFALFVVPLRRALAKHFAVTSPDLTAMVDLAALSYWRAIHTEGLIVRCLAGGLENLQMLKCAERLERIKAAAIAQYVRVVEVLQAATGRTAVLDPDQDAAAVLKFPKLSLANPFWGRPRRASRG